MRRLVALVLLAALAGAGSAFAGGGPGGPQFGYGRYVHEARAVDACATRAASTARYRTCLATQLLHLIESGNDPADELPRIDAYVHSTNGWLAGNCHILMHTVGRLYAEHEHVTLQKLMDYLPKTNDPGCSAGFAHGMLIALGPQIQKLGPHGAAAECAKAGTRYERYSCVHGLGHAYARIYLDFPLPSLNSCRDLGPADAADCADGVFHDYWIAVAGLDDAKSAPGATTSPRVLCGRYGGDFARACWYRAWLEHPPAQPVASAHDLLALCRGLRAVQLKGCVTGASVIRSDNPTVQMATCADVPASLAIACARGVRVPAVANGTRGVRLALIRQCGAFPQAARYGCYWWLGLALNVVENGRFADRGCSGLGTPFARHWCTTGARAFDGPLVTFS
jgi:hypothetical protein